MPWYEPATFAVSTASSLARRTWLPWTSSTTSRMSDADGDAVAPADGLVLVVPTVAVGECTEPAGEAPPQAASSTTATAALKAVPLNLRLMMRKRGSPRLCYGSCAHEAKPPTSSSRHIYTVIRFFWRNQAFSQ